MSECSCSPPLPSPDVDNRSVFCSGPLLDRVQRSNMFSDSKHFVDMSCIFTPAQTMADYEMFSNCSRNDGSLEFLKMFVERHFNPPGSELEPWTPADWKAQPSFLNRVSDPIFKQFAAEINELWKQLGRRINDDVQKNPEMYSMIYVPKPFIIPDTNCREYSYWGSFWIIRGLLQCGMIQTARGMIENFLFLVEQYGYVPACGRIYCLERTQPPLLIMMMKAYVEVTKDEQFAIESLPLLETEFETFVSQRSIEVKGRTMYQYRSASSSPGPRPEAYAADLAAAESIEDEKAREEYYTELKSASESGQEFSSRWFVCKDCSNEPNLSDTRPSVIVPVELNAIIFRSGKILAEFNRKAGNARKAEEYQDRSCTLVKAIRDVLWNSQAGIWLDYDVEKKQSRNYFCCTNFAPLWARAFPLIDTDKVSKGVMEHIKTNKLDDLYGGVPHTLNRKAGEKWDYPNVFPPMMFMVVEGLDNLGTRASKAMSRRWAHRWVKSNYDAFKTQGFMSEKYFCEEFGSSGTSPAQTAVGYGWSNAVIIEFLCKHGREISMSEDDDKGCQCKAGKNKDSYVITSHASMETNAFRTTTSREVEKFKSCVCGELISKTTAAIGTQSSAFRPAPSSKSMDRKSCTCSTNKTTDCGQVLDDCSCAPVVQKPPPPPCCCATRSYSRGRCRHQEVPTCSCSISRTQMVPVELDAEHFSDCPCYHDHGKRKSSRCSRSSSKHKEKPPKEPKEPKQPKQPKQKVRRRSCDCDLSDIKGSTSSETQKLSKKQKKQQEELDGYGAQGQDKSKKMQKEQQDQLSEEQHKFSKKQKKHQEEVTSYSTEEQEKWGKKSKHQQEELSRSASEEQVKYSKKSKQKQEELSRSTSEEQEKYSKKSKQKHEELSRSTSEEQEKYSKKSKQKHEELSRSTSEEQEKYSKKSKQKHEELSRSTSEDQQNLTKKQSKSKESLESHGKKPKGKTQKKPDQEPILSEEDRERERLKRQADLVGHYAPLADKEGDGDDCPKPPPKKNCCECCTDEDASEDNRNYGERKSPSNEVYFSPEPTSTADSCMEGSEGPSAQPSKAAQPSRAHGKRSKSKEQSSNESSGSGIQASGARGRAQHSQSPKCQPQQFGLSDNYSIDERSAHGQGAAQDCPADTEAQYAQGNGAPTCTCSPSQASLSHGKGAHGQVAHGTREFKLCRAQPQPNRLEVEGCSTCRGGLDTLTKAPGRLQNSPCYGGLGPKGYSPTDQNISADDCPCFTRNVGADDIWCAPCPSGKHAKATTPQARQANDQSTQSTTAVCQHCGGAYSGAKQSSKDERDDCDCDLVHLKGMSTIGLQRGCCKPEPRSRPNDCMPHQRPNICSPTIPGHYPKAGEYCSCHGSNNETPQHHENIPSPKRNFELPVYGPDRVPCTCGAGAACSPDPVPSGRPAPVSSARSAPAPAPASAPAPAPTGKKSARSDRTQEEKDYTGDNGPTSMYNKLFPLRDPDSKNDIVCAPKKVEKKCCCCKEQEEEEQ